MNTVFSYLHCPNNDCGSLDIDFGVYDLVDENLWKQECKCNECGQHFTQHYTMTYNNTVFA